VFKSTLKILVGTFVGGVLLIVKIVHNIFIELKRYNIAIVCWDATVDKKVCLVVSIL
jgi:hypothetical protein